MISLFISLNALKIGIQQKNLTIVAQKVKIVIEGEGEGEEMEKIRIMKVAIQKVKIVIQITNIRLIDVVKKIDLILIVNYACLYFYSQ